jgi:hypothetical protein
LESKHYSFEQLQGGESEEDRIQRLRPAARLSCGCFLEGIEPPRLKAIAWCSLLVASWEIGSASFRGDSREEIGHELRRLIRSTRRICPAAAIVSVVAYFAAFEALAFAYPAMLLVPMTLGRLQVPGAALSPQDWNHRHIWIFAIGFYAVVAGLARKRRE